MTPSFKGVEGGGILPNRGGSYPYHQHQWMPQEQHLRESVRTETSSSIRSFCTENEKGPLKGTGGFRGNMSSTHNSKSSLRDSHSAGKPRHLASSNTASVDHLVLRALSHAQGQLNGDIQQQPGQLGQPSMGEEQPTAQQRSQRPSMDKMTSEDSMHYRSSGMKSVASMYSVDTEDSSQQDTGLHFDC